MDLASDDGKSAPHYWSYRALLEDKKRCLTDIPHVRHELANSLEKEGEDQHSSHRAMQERMRHMHMDFNREWDTHRIKTPPHEYEDEGPHFSHKEFVNKKNKLQTNICKADKDRIKAKKDHHKHGHHPHGRVIDPFAISMGDLIQGTAGHAPPADGHEEHERSAFTDRRASDVPHNSRLQFSHKKKHHLTSIHCTPRVMAGNEQVQDGPYDAFTSAYYGDYPSGRNNADWPDGGGGAGVGRYQSQAHFQLDKRRHAAAVDGDAAVEKRRLREEKQHAAETGSNLEFDDNGTHQPNFCARATKYRSLYALQEHKKRHLAELHFQSRQKGEEAPPVADRGLFFSQRTLAYGKKGHTVELKNAAKDQGGSAYQDDVSSVGSSSCDVGKGISRMMHNHREDQVHNSHMEFFLKKKNHATSIHSTPRVVEEKGESDAGSFSSDVSGVRCMREQRSSSVPHVSQKAYNLKKKHHHTAVHAKTSSRMHPNNQNEEELDARRVKMKRARSAESRSVGSTPRTARTLVSHREMNNLKKVHQYATDPDGRPRPIKKALPQPPVPRSGQWTPQHV